MPLESSHVTRKPCLCLKYLIYLLLSSCSSWKNAATTQTHEFSRRRPQILTTFISSERKYINDWLTHWTTVTVLLKTFFFLSALPPVFIRAKDTVPVGWLTLALSTRITGSCYGSWSTSASAGKSLMHAQKILCL